MLQPYDLAHQIAYMHSTLCLLGHKAAAHVAGHCKALMITITHKLQAVMSLLLVAAHTVTIM